MDREEEARKRERPEDQRQRLSYRLGTAVEMSWLKWIVEFTLVLNLLDAVFTVIWVSGGYAEEGNPLLHLQASEHPVRFAMAKFALVSLGSLLLWWQRKRPLAVVGIVLSFLVYYYLLLFHIHALDRLLLPLLPLLPL